MGLWNWLAGVFSTQKYDTREALHYVKTHYDSFGKKIAPEDRPDFERTFLTIARQQITSEAQLLRKQDINLLVNRARIRLTQQPRIMKGAEKYKLQGAMLHKYQIIVSKALLSLDLKFQRFAYTNKQFKNTRRDIQASRITRERTLSGAAQDFLKDLNPLVRETKVIKSVAPALGEVMIAEIARWTELIHTIDALRQDKISYEEMRAYLAAFRKNLPQNKKQVKTALAAADKMVA